MFNENVKKLLKLIYDNLDMDFAMRELETLCALEYGQTFEDYEKSSRYVYDLLEKEGFSPELYTFKADGKTTYHDKRLPIGWSATKGKLTVLKSATKFENPIVADFETMPFSLIKHSVSTPEEGIRTKLVTEEQVWAGEDCTGAMVLLDSETRVFNIGKYLDLGALGVVSDYLSGGVDTPDCVQWVNACTDDCEHWHVQSEDRDFIGFSVSPRTGKKLRSACCKGVVEVLVESDGKRYETEIKGVTATLKGKTNKEFWLFAHLYEPLASDNSMGVAGAVTLLKLIRNLSEKGIIPKPNHTVRVLFALEFYGYSAMYEALGAEVTKNVLGGLDIDGLPEKGKNNLKVMFPPYSSPFFASTFMKSAIEIYSEVFPKTEVFTKTYVGFDDDAFLGDSTTKIPTMWLLFDEERSKARWHNSCMDFSQIDKKKYARMLSVLGLVTILSVCDVINPKEMIDNAMRLAEEKIAKESKRDEDNSRLSFFKAGEREIISDFKKIIQPSLVDEYAQKIDNTYLDFCDKNMGLWQSLAKTIIPKRETIGLPYDMIRAPKSERKPLPDGVLYGPFGLVLSAMDGKKDLERLIRESIWETGEVSSDSIFKRYVNGVYYLAKYGYLSIEEKNPLTKNDLIIALKELGIKKSDVVLLHSALSGCGHVQGGENAIIDAFLDCANTLCCPSFTRPYIIFEGELNREDRFRPYDKNDFENISTGSIPKTMLRRGAIRSNHATHSWCAIGEKAGELLSSHSLLDAPTGEESPLANALKLKGKVVLYGVGANAFTFVHYLEHKANAKFLANAVVKVKNDLGEITTEVIHKHLPGCRDFYSGNGFGSKIMTRAKKMGLDVKSVKFGVGNIYMIDLEEFYNIGMKLFEDDPNVTLCDDPKCLFCRKWSK